MKKYIKICVAILLSCIISIGTIPALAKEYTGTPQKIIIFFDDKETNVTANLLSINRSFDCAYILLKDALEFLDYRCNFLSATKMIANKNNKNELNFNLETFGSVSGYKNYTFKHNTMTINKDFYIHINDFVGIFGYTWNWHSNLKIANIYTKPKDKEYITLYSEKQNAIIVETYLKDYYLKKGYYESLSDFQTVYAPDGRESIIPKSHLKDWLSVGWYEEPVQTLYAENKSCVFKKTEVPAQLTVGWYDEPLVCLYAEGKSAFFKQSEVENQLTVGWFKYPVQRLYALNKSELFKQSEVSTQLSVGWSEYPISEVVAPDGRTQVIPTSDLEAWKKVGWKDLGSEKQKYNLNTIDGIEKFLQKFYSSADTSVGTFKFDIDGYGYTNEYTVHFEYPTDMIFNLTYNTNFTLEQRVAAQEQIKTFMYNAANDVMNRTNLPIEMQFHHGGYKYPTLRVGYSATRFCTCKNYKKEYVTASNGSYLPVIKITGFYWYNLIDDYKF